MMKKTWEAFDRLFKAFDDDTADVFSFGNGPPTDGEYETVREEETRPDGTRVVRTIKRSVRRKT